jgi:hypothetical protein
VLAGLHVVGTSEPMNENAAKLMTWRRLPKKQPYRVERGSGRVGVLVTGA